MNTKSPLLPIFLIVAVDVLGLTIVLPLLPFYAEKYGATPFVVGLLVTTYAVCQLISGPIFGMLSDTMGRRKLLLVSQMGTFIGFLILAFSNSLWMVFLSRIIDGATAGNLSVAQAYISDNTKPEERAKSFGLIGIAFGMGFLVGPAISGFLAQFGYHYPILGAALLSAGSMYATKTLLPRRSLNEIEKRPARPIKIVDFNAYSKFFAIREVAPLLKQSFLFFFCFSLFVSGFALFAERRFRWHGHRFGPREVGLAYAYAGLVGVIVQAYLIDKLVKKYGEYKLITIGFVCSLVGYFVLGYSGKIFTLFIVSTIYSFGAGILRPSLTSLISQNTERRDQGAVMGVTQSLNSFTQIMAPLLSGYLIEHEWLALWTLAAAVTAGVGIFSSVKNKRRGISALSRATA